MEEIVFLNNGKKMNIFDIGINQMELNDAVWQSNVLFCIYSAIFLVIFLHNALKINFKVANKTDF